MICMIHHTDDCDCGKEIITRLDDAVTTLQVASHTIRLLKRDRFELINALEELITSCPADPDTTKRFLVANQRAAQLIAKHKNNN